MPALEAEEGMATDRGPVLPKCEETSTPGHWYCITHGEEFPNNLTMHSHTERGHHVVAWVCWSHGPEVP